MIIYLRTYKEFQKSEYLDQDRHHNHYQCDFHHKKLLLKPGEWKKIGTGLILLTPNKLLTRLSILLAQKKAGISISWSFVSIIKSPKTFATI